MITTKARYSVEQLAWNVQNKAFESVGELTWNGEPLAFATYSEFLKFIGSLTALEKHTLGVIRLFNNETTSELNIAYGLFPDISPLSKWAQSNETTDETIPEEKRYVAYAIEWDRDEEEYEITDTVKRDGKDLEFDTYQGFLDFIATLTEDEKLSLGEWRLFDNWLNWSDNYVTISDGSFYEVNSLSLRAK